MGIKDYVGYALMNNDELHFAKTPEALTPQERWLVTVSAPLSAFNGDFVDAIATGRDLNEMREGVAEMWNVHDRASFEEVAARLTTQGQRDAYLPVWHGMQAIDAAANATPAVLRLAFDAFFPSYYLLRARQKLQLDVMEEVSGRPADELGELFFHARDLTSTLEKHFHTPASSLRSLVAWDAVRLASLSRWAVELGYIERAEFVSFAGGLKAELRKAYSDWSQLSAAYLVSGLIWNGSENRRKYLERTNKLLLSDARSPYRSVPWA